MNNIIIKKLNKVLTTTQETALKNTSVFEYYVNTPTYHWEQIWNDLVDVLKTGCDGSCPVKYLQTVEGKWYTINRVNNVAKIDWDVVQQMLSCEMLVEDVNDENTLNTCLVKFINGIAVELRYNLDVFEKKIVTPIKEDGIVIKKINRKLVNDAQRELINTWGGSMSDRSNPDKKWDEYWTELASVIGYLHDECDGSTRSGSWYTEDHEYIEDYIFTFDDICPDLIAVQNLANDNIECEETDLYCILIKLKNNIPIAVRYNRRWWSYEAEWETNHDLINDEVLCENEYTHKVQFEVVESKHEDIEPILGDMIHEDDKFTLGGVYNIWINEYETEVAEKSLWGTFKTWVSSSWTGFKRLFGW